MMRFLEILTADSTISSLLAGTLSGLIVFFITKPRKNDNDGTQALSMTQINNLSLSIHNNPDKTTTNKTNSQNSDDGSSIIFIVLAVTATLTFFYVKYLDSVLFTYKFLLVSITSFLLLTLINRYHNNYIKGRNWILFITVCFGISSFAFLNLWLVKNPIIEVLSSNEIKTLAQSENVIDFFRSGGTKTLWLSYQMLGMILLLISVINMIPTLIFYNATIAYISKPHSKALALVCKTTSKSSKPTFTLIFSLILIILAFILISGLAHKWITN